MPPPVTAPPKTGAATGATGAYTKLNLVGKGSFGAVFLVRHTKTGGATLIMKEVQTKGLSQGEVRATKQEIAVLKHIRHANIVGYHSTFEIDGLVCILMEYAAGGDLGRLIHLRKKEEARFTESEIKKYLLQLGSALEYLHSDVHLLHRDVKPKNVFLSAEGDVRLGDFGLSKVLSKSDGESEARVGTPLYMSPELAMGEPYDRSADVWAFAATIYECMSFKPPWSELCTADGGIEGGMKGLQKALNTKKLEVDSLTLYSENLRETLKKLLARKRKERMTLAQLIAQLTEKPIIPASWGLSAEAQAALEAANTLEAQSQPTAPPLQPFNTGKSTQRRNSKQHGSSSGSSSNHAAPPTPPLWGKPLYEALHPVDIGDAHDDDEEEATGIELHAAAGVLQRSFRVQRSKQAIQNKKKMVAIHAPGDSGQKPTSPPPALKVPPTKPPTLREDAAGAAVGGQPPRSRRHSGTPRDAAAMKAAAALAGAGARPGSAAGGAGGAGGGTPGAKKPALKPASVAALKPAHPPSNPAKVFRAPSPRPSHRGEAPSATAPKKKAGLKPTRVRDGFG